MMDVENSTLITTLVSTTAASSTLPSWTGFIFLICSSILYGSNYLPVKQYETGDGMFFQLIVCVGIWIVGFVLNIVRGFPEFYALPLLGGFLWSTGNNTVVPIIQTIGIGLGMIFWNAIGLITGWATGRFGLFGLTKEVPSNKILNYLGVLFVLLSTFFYLMVQPVDNSKSDEDEGTNSGPDERTNLLDSTNESTNTASLEQSQKQNASTESDSFIARMSTMKKRILGISLSVFAGLLYGEAFSPIVYIRNNYKGASQNSMDYLFSFYTGILVTSLIYFTIYAIYKKNKPILYSQLVLPGLASGIMWGLANICYFNANNVLSQAIIFPISNSGPPIVANLWGVFLYKEIKGTKNFLFLLGGFAVALSGAVMSGLSF